MKTNNRTFLSTIVVTVAIALLSSLSVVAAPFQDKMKPAESKMQPAKPMAKKKMAAKPKAKKAKMNKMAMDTASKM